MDVGTVLSAAQTLFAAVQSSELKKTCSILGYKSQLDALQVTVSTISTVLRSAEAKQELSDEEIIYVEDLKDAIYEADDLLDEFVTLVEHKKLTEGDKKMRLFSVFKELGVAYKMSSGVEKIKKKLDAIAYNNQGLGKLSSLHRLSNFIVGGKGRNLSWKQWFYGLEDLKALEKLKGSLEIQIRWPKNAKSIVKEDCRRDGLYLRSKEHLNGIWFNFTHEESDGRVDDEIARRLMEELQPHSNLKRFKMQEYHGARMPGWATLLPNLLQLCLFNCDELECLPFLGNLCNLKVLKLLALEKLEYIEENSPSADSSSTPTPQLLCAKTLSYLPSLRVLSLNNLPELKGWRRSLAGVGNDHLNQNLVVSRSNNEAVWQSLPCLSQLKSLEIIGCPKLTCIPLCPSLEWLYIIKSNERLNEKYIMKGMRS
ncbi:hypothetical protein SOVF_198820 [Spinacia oleracea]|nr:hypothetical protein SOVF_198820 [Spinacia oleracea]